MANTTRQLWTALLVKTAQPIFEALAADQLRVRMPVEQHPQASERELFTHLEAVGRSLSGIGPWLELNTVQTAEEQKQQTELRQFVHTGLKHATDPQAQDFLNFSNGGQPLVDAAFLAQGLLRSWNSVWLKLEADVQSQVISCMKSTRVIRPCFNNWLLFSATIEAFLCKAGADWDRMRIDYAIRQHEQWYLGDGYYGDGPQYHCDYYNSFVIHPMLYDIVHACDEISNVFSEFKEKIIKRAQRHAVTQERMINADGSFPPIGRSLAYRFGIFQNLALMILHKKMTDASSPAGLRCAMTAAMTKLMLAEGTFDKNGWLQIGFCGHQPMLGETYISTGSLYLTLCGFLPLGLPASHPFWADPDCSWTAADIWNGKDMLVDHALHD